MWEAQENSFQSTLIFVLEIYTWHGNTLMIEKKDFGIKKTSSLHPHFTSEDLKLGKVK